MRSTAHPPNIFKSICHAAPHLGCIFLYYYIIEIPIVYVVIEYRKINLAFASVSAIYGIFSDLGYLWLKSNETRMCTKQEDQAAIVHHSNHIINRIECFRLLHPYPN